MDPILEKYLEEVRAAERVLENEPALLESARSGDAEARATLVRTYLYRTAEIGLRLAPEGMEELNAIQEANVVLLQLVTQTPEPGLAHQLELALRNHLATRK